MSAQKYSYSFNPQKIDVQFPSPAHRKAAVYGAKTTGLGSTNRRIRRQKPVVWETETAAFGKPNRRGHCNWNALRRNTKLLLRYFSRTISFSDSSSGVP